MAGADIKDCEVEVAVGAEESGGGDAKLVKVAVDGGAVEGVDSGAEKEHVDGELELVEDGTVGSVEVIEISAETSAATFDVELREEHEDAIAGDGIVVDVENAEDGLAEPAGHHR